MRQDWNLRIQIVYVGLELRTVVLFVVTVLAQTFSVNHFVGVDAVVRGCLAAVQVVTQVAHPFRVVFLISVWTSCYLFSFDAGFAVASWRPSLVAWLTDLLFSGKFASDLLRLSGFRV